MALDIPNDAPAGSCVLVVGASGALGRPAVLRLRARGVAVRAMCRHPQAAPELAAAGAELVAGDLIDPASLRRACAGATHVLAAAHSLLGRGRWRSSAVDDAGHRALIGAAREAGVRRFVYTSALLVESGLELDFVATKAAIEHALRDSGLAHSILRLSAFMEHHVHRFNGAGVLAQGVARLIGPGTKRRNFVAGDDVARIAVHQLLDETAAASVVAIGGPDHATDREVAELYARLAGVALKVSALPLGVARTLAVVMRPFHPGVARLMRIASQPEEAFDERFDGAAVLQARYGFELTRLEDFVAARVREHRASAQGQLPIT